MICFHLNKRLLYFFGAGRAIPGFANATVF